MNTKLVDEKDIDSCQEKIMKYIYNENVFFDSKDYICLTYIWIGINNEKAMYIIQKLMPEVFNDCMEDDKSSWDKVISKLLENLDRFSSIMFKIILMDVTWEIFNNSKKLKKNE